MPYSLSDYCDMVADSVRINAYRDALKQVITPESTVLDIGCGSGIFCLLACKMGARHVYGIEPDSSIHMAKKLMKANGFSDRSTFYNLTTEEVTLPEKVDIIISDLRGALPLYGHHLKIINDARTRFLKQGGALIPQSDRLYMAPISDSTLYDSLNHTWLNDFEKGLDFSVLLDTFSDHWQCVTLKPEAVRGTHQLWGELDYTSPLPESVKKDAEWTFTTPQTLHGIGVWFDCTTWKDIGFSANPSAKNRPSVYGNAFFPFKKPLTLAPGDTLAVNMAAHQLESDFVINWETKHTHGNQVSTFKQSSMTAEIPTADSLKRRADNYIPNLSTYGHIELSILTGMKANKSLGDIAHELADQFPEQFSTWHKALTHVGTIASAYSRDRK